MRGRIIGWRATTCAVMAAALLLGACGDTGDDGGGVDEDFVVYTADDVVAHVEGLTGVRLVSSSGQGLTFLNFPTGRSADIARLRYGSFAVTVTSDRGALEAITQGGGPDQQALENVIVDLPGGEPEQTERVRRIFATLGTPLSEIRRPPEETPCEEARIDPGGGQGREGTCRLDQQTLQIVNAGSELDLPAVRLSDLRVDSGTVLTTRGILGDRFEASGGYVGIEVDVENTGSAPVDSLRPSVVIDGRRYSEDPEGSFRYQSDTPYPIQPGDRASVRFLFDITDEAAGRALDEGTFELVADEEGSSVDFALGIARIRLGGADEIEGGGGEDGGELTGSL